MVQTEMSRGLRQLNLLCMNFKGTEISVVCDLACRWFYDFVQWKHVSFVNSLLNK